MSVWPVLLRVLLAVALVFNGVSTAAASVHLGHLGAMAPAQSVKVPPVQTATAEEPPCHQHHHAEALGDAHPVPSEKAAKSESASPDCCKSGACRCTCVHHAPVAIAAFGFFVPAIEHADNVRPKSTRHSSPALPHLIRPPIG